MLLFIGCEKIKLSQKIEVDPTGNAWVKVVHLMPYSSVNNKALQITFDGVRVGNSADMLYGFPSPGGGYNTPGLSNPDYYSITPGNRVFSLAIPKVGTNLDSVSYFISPLTLTGGQRQSIILTDTGAATVATIITDLITDPNVGFARAKFFNGIPNAGPIDLYTGPAAGPFTLVVAGVPYRGTSAYFEFAAPAASVMFHIVRSGQDVNVAANRIGTYNFASSAAGRVYTVVSRGYFGVSASDTRRPMISLYVNR